MFWVKEDDEIPKEICWNNDYPQVVERYDKKMNSIKIISNYDSISFHSFLPVDVDIPPRTLFDINPTYPKLSPNDWAIMNMNISSSNSKSIDNNINTLFLTHLKDNRLGYRHKLLLIFSIWGLLMLIGFSILFIVIIRSRKNKKYVLRNNNRTKSITVGGETSSFSGWLTKRRFQQYDQDDHDHVEYKQLSGKHRWASESEESDLSDNEIFTKTNFQNVVLRN